MSADLHERVLGDAFRILGWVSRLWEFVGILIRWRLPAGLLRRGASGFTGSDAPRLGSARLVAAGTAWLAR